MISTAQNILSINCKVLESKTHLNGCFELMRPGFILQLEYFCGSNKAVLNQLLSAVEEIDFNDKLALNRIRFTPNHIGFKAKENIGEKVKIYLKLKELYTIEKDIDCKIIKDFDVQKLNNVIIKDKNGFIKEGDFEDTDKNIAKIPFQK